MGEPLSTKPPSGFRDFFGSEARRRALLVRRISEIYESFGFDPLETSAIENIETLVGSGGGDNEKLIFKIMKRGDKLKESLENMPTENTLTDLGLRFDLTVPLARVVAEYQSQIKSPWKVYHAAPVWRAERAQKGRFREFFQCDVDIIGSTSTAAEVEVIQAVVTAASSLAGPDFELRINDRRLMRALAESLGFVGDKADSFAIILDKKDKVDFQKLRMEWQGLLGSALPSEIDRLQLSSQNLEDYRSIHPEAVDGLCRIVSLLEALNLPLKGISFDPSLARGLGYYSGPVFELRHQSAGYSLGGGGRYDHLIGRFLKKSVPAVGFSIGFERLLLLMAEKEALVKAPRAEVFVAVVSEDLRPQVLRLASVLRSSGLQVSVYPGEGKLKSQLKYASDLSFRWVLILGEDEFRSSVAIVKDFASGGEERVAFSDLQRFLRVEK